MSELHGWVNGNPVYSRDEYIFAKRRFGPMNTDEEILEYARKQTWDWQVAGHKQSFEGFYLSDYALSEPLHSLTLDEFARLKKMQAERRAEMKRIELERKWELVDTVGYADNSVEEIWEDKDGNRKTIMTVYPHGDAC